MDIAKAIADASALFAQGREAVAKIVDAVNDGKVAVDAKTQADLDALLAQEQAETAAAHQALQDAIAKRLA